jgi:Leucine-rich repeat (LRR) protein
MTIMNSTPCNQLLTFDAVKAISILCRKFPGSDIDELKENLKSLDISRYGIKTIAPFLFFKNLTRLDASYNLISEIEGIESLIELGNLNLCSNQISHFPEAIGQLTNLEVLSFCNNNLTEIPRCIENLTNLKQLYLNLNPIREIPDEVGKLVNLEELCLGDSEIKFIPDWIGKLINLQILDLDHTKISIIPEKILNLQKLETVYLAFTNVDEDDPVIKALLDKGVRVKISHPQE